MVIYGAIGSAGFTLGLVAGGLLTSVSWRWVFFAPVIVGALLLLAGRALIRADEPRVRTNAGFDLGGAVTITGPMICAILALVLLAEGVDDDEQGLAGGVLYTAFQFGAALGLALVAVVLNGHEGSVGLAEYRTGHVVPTVLAVAAAAVVVAAVLARRRPRRARFGSSVQIGG